VTGRSLASPLPSRCQPDRSEPVRTGPSPARIGPRESVTKSRTHGGNPWLTRISAAAPKTLAADLEHPG